jgi:hypothetical protein
MIFLSVVSAIPLNISLIFVSLVLIFGGLVWYALRVKGDVRAVFSHGKTVLELEAKEPNTRK